MINLDVTLRTLREGEEIIGDIIAQLLPCHQKTAPANSSLRYSPERGTIYTPMEREKAITSISNRERPWDVIIIGGGATGVGCALDAASRGCDVLLLEQHDFGKGTSSRSTKLIHGGVRYLQQGNIALVREALKERELLLKNAPHVVHKQAFIIPCYTIAWKLLYWLGLKVYDLLAGGQGIGRTRMLSREETLGRLPTIKSYGLSGGVLYYDAQFDDTRLLIDLARAAHNLGATILNYARVDSFCRSLDGAIAGVAFTDLETGLKLSASSKAVINATGIFSDRIRQLSDRDARPTVTFAQGAHIVLDRKFLRSEAAVMIPKTSDGRVLFCIPWHGHVLVGTTDTPVPSAELEPAALESEIDFILETCSAHMTINPVRSDILSVFSGIRPLINKTNVKNTASLSRSYELFTDPSGLITITGGKWTTYRRMAEEAVTKAIEVAGLEARPCVTRELSITGREQGLGARLHPDLPCTHDDIVRAIRDEMARTVEDALARRTRALFLNAKAAVEIAPAVAAIMASELGQDDRWIKNELELFENLAAGYSVETASSP